MINLDPADFMPIVVEVKNGRWDAYGDPTVRTRYLIMMLESIGGVNESVPPGQYLFNVLDVDGQPVVSLTPRV